MKKIVSLILAMMMILSLATTAFAANENGTPTTGSISITGAAVEDGKFVANYVAYKMFDLVSYNAAEKKYSYKPVAPWDAFIEGEGSAYFKLNENKYVEWVGAENEARYAAAAQAALAFAKKTSGVTAITNPSMVNPTTDSNGNDTATVQFSGLDLGYYLVDSSMGVLCGLTTTNPAAYMAAKNAPPSIEKRVQEDSLVNTGASYSSSNDASIGEEVFFDTTITVHAGAQNYHLYDKMDAGLTFDSIISVNYVPSSGAREYLVEGNQYDLITREDDPHYFEIEFSQAFCNSLRTGDLIIVLYKAILNEDAVLYKTKADGTKNETWLTFGEGGAHSTEPDSTITYTYGFHLAKTDSERNLLPGAKFRMYDAATGGNEIKVTEVVTDEETYYRLAVDGEEGDVIDVVNGVVTIVGLDSATYYLEEIEAPPGGYNKLAERQAFTISGNNLFTNLTDNGTKVETNTGVQVVNKAGTILPETGGMGTTLFITIGAMMVMAAGVLLVTKKRMSMIEE